MPAAVSASGCADTNDMRSSSRTLTDPQSDRSGCGGAPRRSDHGWLGTNGWFSFHATIHTFWMPCSAKQTCSSLSSVSWLWGCSAPEMFDSSPDPEATLSPGCTRAIDHRRRSGRDVVGLRERTRAT
jgi:hypothetical protein